MKQLNLFKNLFLVTLLGVASTLNAQVHPLAFGPHTIAGGGTTLSSPNWYADYVGAKVVVTAPAPIAGPVAADVAIIGPSDWPDIVWTSIVNVPIVMDVTDCDSFGGVGYPAGFFSGKIAVIWRGPISISGACYTGTTYDFGLKALNAQNAGARAVVFINEYPGQPPIIPGYTAHGTPITIPVLMIGNTDGATIASAYHSYPAGTVKMTLTPWGLGNANDIGLVPSGQALYQYYAIPDSQLIAGNAQFPYQGLDGSFIANFGSNSAYGVKLKSTLSFTGVDGVTSVKHTDSLLFAGPFTGTGTTDTLADSIMAMFSSTHSDYNLTATAPGRYDLNYSLSSDSVDQFMGDNSITTSFYVTDSLFSRGRYDFVNHKPLSNSYEAYANATEITWGTFYYIAKGGSYISQIQYNVSNGRTAHPANLIGSNDIYVFKWVDGSNSLGFDSLVQDGELDLVSWTTHPFVAGVDTSGCTITVSALNDSADANPATISLNANTWYYVAIDLPGVAAATDSLYLGIDGVSNPYPRIFGRWWETNQRYLDYSNFVGTNASTFTTAPTNYEAALPFTQTSFLQVVDSFSWTNVKGMIPSIALQTTTHLPAVSHVGVQNQVKPSVDVTLFPNPAKDVMNVSVALGQTAKSITYKVIDGLGRAVGVETHNNVLNENYTINTAAMRSGTYFLLITADDMHASKKFTVIK